MFIKQSQPSSSLLFILLFFYSRRTGSFSIVIPLNSSHSLLHQQLSGFEHNDRNANDIVGTDDFSFIGLELQQQQVIIKHASSCIHDDKDEDGRLLSAFFGSAHLRDNFFNNAYGRRVAHFPRSSVGMRMDKFGDTVMTSEKSLKAAPISGIDLPSLYITNEWTSLRKRGSQDILDKTVMSYPQMSEYIADGGSIIIPITPEDYLFPMKMQIERALGMKAETGTTMNIYHSGPCAVALNIHYDAYPVFVLQLVGMKDWMVQDNAFGQNVASVTRWKNVTMMEGDLLYIPKGVFHAATTAEGCDTSTHATIGLL